MAFEVTGVIGTIITGESIDITGSDFSAERVDALDNVSVVPSPQLLSGDRCDAETGTGGITDGCRRDIEEADKMKRAAIRITGIIMFTILATGVAFADSVPSAPTSITVDGDTAPLLSWADAASAARAWTYFDVDSDPQTQFEIHTHIRGSVHTGAELNAHYYGDSGYDGDANYSNIQAGSSPSTTTWSTSGITPTRGVYYDWFVKVADTDGWSDWSDEGHYKINTLPQSPQSISVGSGSGEDAGSKATAPSGSTIHVATDGNDGTGDGSVGNPYLTLNYAYSVCSAGDTIELHAGTYNTGRLDLDKAGTSRSAPITIQGADGEVVYVQRSASLHAGEAFRTDTSHHIVKDLTIQNSGKSGYAAVFNLDEEVENVIFENCTFSGNYTSIKTYNGELTIRNCAFTGESSVAIETLGYSNCIIENNVFENSTYTRPITISTYSPVCQVKNNVFRNLAISGAERCALLIYGGYNNRIQNNLFYDITFAGTGYSYILVTRGNTNIIANNTIIGQKALRDEIGLYLKGSHERVYNNILHNIDLGIDEMSVYLPDNTLVTSNTYNNNCFSDLNRIMITQDGSKDLLLDAEYPDNFETSAIAFTDSANDDYTLQVTSPCVNTGDTSTPVPTSGGATRDVGAFEYGATPFAVETDGDWSFNAVTFQSEFSTSDTTPTISWTFTDVDNDYSGIIDPWTANTQATFQAQLDTVPTFDSSNRIDSGTVSSSTSAWTIPAAVSLSVGQYYFRVRTADNIESDIWGTWSDGDIALAITEAEADVTPPYVDQMYPADLAEGVAVGTTISCHVKDDGNGVDIDTIVMRVNGQIVTPVITGTPADYTLTYTPPSSLEYGTVYTVTVDASDLGE